MVEKCIIAFELVGRLSAAKLDFVFKGGTSLLLHLRPIRRLSIDADITTNAALPELHKALRQVTLMPPFNGYTYQDWRDRENPPTRHFQIAYLSPTQGRPWSIQLDVLTGDVHYPDIESKPIEMELLEIETPQVVRVPSVEGLLGDKLTAFAPATVGVLYDPPPRATGGRKPEPDPVRALKQLFDVGELFAAANDMRSVARTYDAAFNLQNAARGGVFTRAQALDDSLDAALQIAELGLPKPNRNHKTDFFNQGIKPLDSHLLGARFNISAAQIPAARAAFLAALLRAGRLDCPLADLRAIPPPAELASRTITGRFARLSRLRKTSSEAFHYWREAAELLAATR